MNVRILCCIAALLTPGAVLATQAAGGGNEVIVIYNTRVPESKRVADHYAERRQVPTNQIFGFALPTDADITRAEFRDNLEKPLAKALQDRKLWSVGTVTIPASSNSPAKAVFRVRESKIRYAVVCYGVPYRIRRDTSLKEPIEDTMRPELRRNEASVDADLAMLPRLEERYPLAGPLANPLYSVTNAALFHPTNGILMVTRLDGPSPAIARGLIDKAIEAEENGMWGRAYFDTRNIDEPGYKMGDDWIRAAAEVCRSLGFTTVIDTNPATFQADFPLSQVAIYCGWYDTDYSGPFRRKTVEFMPGAFAYHLQSFSAANLRSATNSWVGPFLDKGATITMGVVDEPYLMGTPDVSVFCARLIFQGFSFAEAAYASQGVLSWQLTAIGDPLYRPFGKPAQQLHVELEQRKSKLAEWSHLRAANLNLARNMPMGNVANYLTQVEATRTSAVLTEKLADIFAAQGKPASALEFYERALERDPSPQQRIRLRLLIADRLTAEGRDKDLYDNLWKLVTESPDYAGRFTVMKKLLDMAIKSGQKEEITRCVNLMQGYVPEEN